MALIKYTEWKLKMAESSPSTRRRDGWARGNYPPMADVMSHSTPSPFIIKKAKEELEDKPKKKKKKKEK